MEKVRNFLTLFKPEIVTDIVPINDVYGPTGWDPDIQALVVSKETLSGADASKLNQQYLIEQHINTIAILSRKISRRTQSPRIADLPH